MLNITLGEMMTKDELLRLLNSLDADDEIHNIWAAFNSAESVFVYVHCVCRPEHVIVWLETLTDDFDELLVYRDAQDRITIDVAVQGDPGRDWEMRPL